MSPYMKISSQENFEATISDFFHSFSFWDTSDQSMEGLYENCRDEYESVHKNKLAGASWKKSSKI